MGEELQKDAMKSKSVKPFDITGRPMKGWVMVEQSGFKKDEKLKEWIEIAKKFVKKLPAK